MTISKQHFILHHVKKILKIHKVLFCKPTIKQNVARLLNLKERVKTNPKQKSKLSNIFLPEVIMPTDQKTEKEHYNMKVKSRHTYDLQTQCFDNKSYVLT